MVTKCLCPLESFERLKRGGMRVSVSKNHEDERELVRHLTNRRMLKDE